VGNAAPPADVLYNNALRDYNSGKYDLSSQEFGDYIKYYSNTDLAANAQFYLADIEYRQGNFEAAVKDYDKVLEHIPAATKLQPHSSRRVMLCWNWDNAKLAFAS